ncbi:MAG: PQQ-dependent sugar dehydrogenase [Pirellulales bacterium]
MRCGRWFELACLVTFLLLLPTAKGQTLSLEPIVTSGIANPMFVTSPPGDPSRLFVAERSGRIRIIDLATNTVSPTPFLSIPVSTDGERGLLGMSFDPEYATNGRFYVNYTVASGADVGDLVIARYTANGDPLTATTANPAEFRLLRLDRPSTSTSNHNGGWIGFSPNNPNNLYIAVGDGGGGNDTFNTAQNLNSPHGKMLRIDVNNPSGGQNYGIPAGNPFATGGGLPEIWSVGLRNPWRNSFDRETGDLWIADVGQSAREEIDFQPADAPGGLNYGWAFREGDIAGPKAPPTPTPATVNPIHVLPRSQGASVTGGYVYRGGIESLQGTYLFGDFISGRTWTLKYDGATVGGLTERTSQLDPDGAGAFGWGGRLASFGEDANGELYMVALTSVGGNGAIYRVASVLTWNVDADGNWSLAANWTGAVPNAAGARAVFGSAIRAPRTVTLDVPITLGRLDFDSASAYTVAGASALSFDVTNGAAQLNVTRGNHTIGAPLMLADNTVISVSPASNLSLQGGVSADGVNLAKAGAGTLVLNQIEAAGLSINAGSVQIASAAGAPGTSPSVLGALSIAGGTAPTGRLDLTDNAMVIDYSGASSVATVRQQIITGRGGPGLGGSWNGTGITSSTAAAANATAPDSRSVGYAENSSLPLGSYTSFRGQPVDDTSLLLTYARTGDANLDGVVNDDDVTIVGATYAPGVPQPHWGLGDFDYNGFVDDDDVTLLGVFYDPSATPLTAAAQGQSTVAPVPEPSTLLLLTCCLAFLLTPRLAPRRWSPK